MPSEYLSPCLVSRLNQQYIIKKHVHLYIYSWRELLYFFEFMVACMHEPACQSLSVPMHVLKFTQVELVSNGFIAIQFCGLARGYIFHSLIRQIM